MTRVKALIAGSLGTLAFAASAHAADPGKTWRPPPAEPAYERPAPEYRELMSGWYLRGDLGYRLNSIGSSEGASPIASQNYGNTVAGTLGFGYKYQWLRVDFTADRGAPSKIGATTKTSGALQPQYAAKVGSLSAMANVYIDFGTWWGFTPYIGGGAGATQLASKNYSDSSSVPTTVLEEGHALNFSWAWMAGVAFQVTPNWMIDVGFRHLQLGDVPGSAGAGTVTTAAVFKNLSTNEGRIGFRFLFD